MNKKKAVYFLIVFSLTGLCLNLFNTKGTSSNHQLLVRSSESFQKAPPESQPDALFTRAGTSVSKDFYHVGVLSSWNFMSSRMQHVYHTWGKEAKSISFYVGKRNTSTSNSSGVGWIRSYITELAAVRDDEYPARHKSFEMFRHWCRDELLSKYKWFVRADDDTYLRVHQLERLLVGLDHDKVHYLGRNGQGIKFEREKLGLNGNRFCCGPLVVYSHAAVKKMCPHINECIADKRSHHEDTEIGRCAFKHLQVQCATNKKNQMGELFFHRYERDDATIFHGNLTAKKFFKHAISMHEIKHAEVMYNVAYNDMLTRKNPVKLPVAKSNPLKIFQPSLVSL